MFKNKLFKKSIFVLPFLIILVLGIFLFKNKDNTSGGSTPKRGVESYKSVKVNGKNMWAHVKGSGDKTVVMLSGWGVDSPVDDYYPLYDMLSKDYKVVVLEYFGYFNSDITNDERTNKKMVEEIRESLDKLNIKPPYILMPHSMSGLYSLYYANKYPSEVSAIIGLDMSLPQKQLERWNGENFEKTKQEKASSGLNTSVLNQWNAFYDNSKKLENVRYPYNLPVLAFLTKEQVNDVDKMIKSGEMKTSWVEINNKMITNPTLQSIKVLDATHSNIAYDQTDLIVDLSKKFIENL